MPRCLNCKEKFEAKTFLQKFCLDSEKGCFDAFMAWKKEKQKQNNTKQWKAEKTVLKEKLKTLSDWKNDLQKEINAIVREIDKGHPCISSGRDLGKSYDAGHFLGRQSFPEVRFHLMNIYAQSVEQNQHKSGNPIGFMDGLEQTFGKEHLEAVMALKSYPALLIALDEIKEKIPICRSILKWLKLQERTFTNQERLELRKQFNSQIGIYKPS